MQKCAGCKRVISGQFVQALGRDWHPQCFVCRVCGRPLGNAPFKVQDNQPYHQRCYQHRFGKTCAACGRPIETTVLNALEKTWHPDCFACAGCGKPIGSRSFLLKDARPFHDTCYHEHFTPPCDVCRKPLTGRFIQDPWGKNYCAEHTKRLAPCFSCGRLICDRLTGGGRRYRDGTRICNLCFATAIIDHVEGEHHFQTVRKGFEDLGFFFGGAPTPFRLVDTRELLKFTKKKQKGRPLMGMARTQIAVSGKRIVKRAFLEVLVLYGLPREHFETVAIHELCHAWLFYNQCYGLPERVEEGLCSLCEFLWLQHHPSPTSEVRKKMIMENKDPIYGDGFRAAHKAMTGFGLPELLDFIKKHKRFPGAGGFLRRLFT